MGTTGFLKKETRQTTVLTQPSNPQNQYSNYRAPLTTLSGNHPFAPDPKVAGPTSGRVILNVKQHISHCRTETVREVGSHDSGKALIE